MREPSLLGMSPSFLGVNPSFLGVNRRTKNRAQEKAVRKKKPGRCGRDDRKKLEKLSSRALRRLRATVVVVSKLGRKTFLVNIRSRLGVAREAAT